jgi:hypothetical protein
MTTRFLAEDFRKLMDALDEIKDDAKDDTEKHADVEDFMQVERPEGVSKEDIEYVEDLVGYLDQFPELDQWRDDSAQYDDAYYEDVPLDKLETIAGLDQSDLERISSGFEQYAGAVLIQDGKVTIYGES